jgi:hypothetical protein
VEIRIMPINTIHLPTGRAVVITATSAATYYPMNGAVPGTPIPIAAGADSALVGPFGTPRVYAVSSEKPAVYVYSTPDPFAAGDSLTGAVLTSPTLITPILGTVVSGDVSACTSAGQTFSAPVLGVASATSIDGVNFSSGDGAPVDAVQASLDRDPAGDDNALTFTAKDYGAGGNAITITYVDPGDNDQVLGIVVVGTDAVVNLATGVAGAIESTAAEILAEWEGTAPALALATVIIDTSDTGVADDGSGVVTALAEANFTSGAGTGIGSALKGGVYSDLTNAKLYIQSGEVGAPVWKLVTSAA